MARYIGPVCRLCRREGMKLFLKGERCYTEKCAIEKRNFPPGQHGSAEGEDAGYGLQLREKQKVKRIYGVLEDQFRRYFEAADADARHHRREAAAVLERRLDNVVYRLGLRDLAAAGAAARAPRPLPGQRQEGRHPVVLGEAGRRDHGARPRAQKNADDRARNGRSEGPRHSRLALFDAAAITAGSCRCRRASRSTCPSGTADRRAVLEVETAGIKLAKVGDLAVRDELSHPPARSLQQTCGGRPVSSRAGLEARLPARWRKDSSRCCGKVFSGPSGWSSNAKR